MLLPDMIDAIYEDNQLRLLQPVSLHNHQRVKVIVMTEQAAGQSDSVRVQRLHEEADRWLATQPKSAVREPEPLSLASRERIDSEFEKLLSEIRAESTAGSEANIEALVNTATATMRGYA